MKLHVLRALMYITKMNGTEGHRSFAFCSAFSLSILGFATQESAGISIRFAQARPRMRALTDCALWKSGGEAGLGSRLVMPAACGVSITLIHSQSLQKSSRVGLVHELVGG